MMPVVGVAGSSRGRRWLIRVFGWLALAVVVPVLAACGARSLERPEIVPEPTGIGKGPVVLNRNVDLLFMIDDSSSMRLSQESLLRNFPVLMTALENMPGGLPNVHIAVVSSDMGAGDGSIRRLRRDRRRQERRSSSTPPAAPAPRPASIRARNSSPTSAA